jgi:hypothetical protein
MSCDGVEPLALTIASSLSDVEAAREKPNSRRVATCWQVHHDCAHGRGGYESHLGIARDTQTICGMISPSQAALRAHRAVADGELPRRRNDGPAEASGRDGCWSLGRKRAGGQPCRHPLFGALGQFSDESGYCIT